MTAEDVQTIQAELRRIADSLDTDPPHADTLVLESALIVDEYTAFKLALEVSPYY